MATVVALKETFNLEWLNAALDLVLTYGTLVSSELPRVLFHEPFYDPIFRCGNKTIDFCTNMTATHTNDHMISCSLLKHISLATSAPAVVIQLWSMARIRPEELPGVCKLSSGSDKVFQRWWKYSLFHIPITFCLLSSISVSGIYTWTMWWCVCLWLGIDLFLSFLMTSWVAFQSLQ